jgi:hypothetical protein
MDEKLSKKNILREQLIKNKLNNTLGKYASVDHISYIIKETTGLTFNPIGYAKSLHWVNETADTNDSKIGWCMHPYTDERNNSDENKTEKLDVPSSDTYGTPSGARGAPSGDIIIYEEDITFDDNKIYYLDNYLDLNKQIEEPRYWFWRVIHNRYNNTYTLKRIELGVECTNIKTNVPLKIILKILYDKVKKYEAYKLK